MSVAGNSEVEYGDGIWRVRDLVSKVLKFRYIPVKRLGFADMRCCKRQSFYSIVTSNCLSFVTHDVFALNCVSHL